MSAYRSVIYHAHTRNTDLLEMLKRAKEEDKTVPATLFTSHHQISTQRHNIIATPHLGNQSTNYQSAGDRDGECGLGDLGRDGEGGGVCGWGLWEGVLRALGGLES